MAVITCIECNKTAERSGHGAIRCLPCSKILRPRIAAAGRVRNGVPVPVKIDGVWCCVDCNTPVSQSEHSGRKWRPAARCPGCSAAAAHLRAATQTKASLAVSLAIQTGQLAPAAGQPCADCGRPAIEYDHRDYTQPLKVQPVCRSCNVMRGPADVWPEGTGPSHLKPAAITARKQKATA